MELRRVLPTAVVIASVGVLTAVTIPAIAGTDRDDDTVRGAPDAAADQPPPTIAVEVAPELLDALQRDLGLSEEEALARLRQEAWASQTATALSDALGDQYAGAWLNQGADQLMIAVTDEAAAERVRAAGAEPQVVTRSARYLDGVKGTLDQHATGAADAIAGWYVDVATNTVVLVAPDWAESEARDFAADAGVWGDAVRIVAAEEQPRLLFDVQGGDAYFINNASRCSVGFSVVGGFVTAGHCNLAGDTTAGFNGEAQGEFVASSFPGVGLSGPDDWGVVAVNDDWVPQPVVNDFEGGLLPVAGAEEAPVGASICKYGSTTGVSCGVVQAKNATVNYPEGTVTGLTRTNVCAEPGDSGGAWLSGDQAQGVTSGGSGDCTVGGTTFFQPLAEILELNDLTLVTTDGGGSAPVEEAPPAEQAPPAQTVCADSEHTFRGSLTGQRTAQAQPNNRFYRALSAGTHTVCLEGPDGTNFDLALQAWNGTEFESVAAATGPSSSEALTFDGPAGFYRAVAVAQSGQGSYLVGVSFDAT